MIMNIFFIQSDNEYYHQRVKKDNKDKHIAR